MTVEEEEGAGRVALTWEGKGRGGGIGRERRGGKEGIRGGREGDMKGEKRGIWRKEVR